MRFNKNPFEYRESRADQLISLEKQAKQYLNRHAIDMSELSDIYSPETIMDDIRQVNRRRHSFEQNNTAEEKESAKLATIMEAIIFEHGEMSDWFGPDANTIKTSVYDDLINGVDGLVEFIDPSHNYSHLAFGVDATYGHYMDKKLNRIIKSIEAGSLTKIKYFRSEHLNMRGVLDKVPLFILAARPKTVNHLADLWAEKNNRELGQHPIQYQILDEIIIQATAFQTIAERVSQPQIAQVYSRIGNKIGHILEQKMAELATDPVKDDAYFELEQELEKIKN